MRSSTRFPKSFRSTRLERELALARLVLVASLLAGLVLSRNVDSAERVYSEPAGPKVSENYYEALGDACPDQEDRRFSE